MRCVCFPTASATLSPYKENTVLTSLMQALLGQNGIFLACPSDKVGGGNELHKRGMGRRPRRRTCSNAVGEGLAPPVQTVIANGIGTSNETACTNNDDLPLWDEGSATRCAYHEVVDEVLKTKDTFTNNTSSVVAD